MEIDGVIQAFLKRKKIKETTHYTVSTPQNLFRINMKLLGDLNRLLNTIRYEKKRLHISRGFVIKITSVSTGKKE